MMQAPIPQPGSRKVEPTQTRRRRKTTPSDTRRQAERKRRSIEKAAQDRHDAWGQTGIPVATTVYRLTRELDELYDCKRREDRT